MGERGGRYAIRGCFLDKGKEAFDRKPNHTTLLQNDFFTKALINHQAVWWCVILRVIQLRFGDTGVQHRAARLPTCIGPRGSRVASGV